jgi:hypothetical protein
MYSQVPAGFLGIGGISELERSVDGHSQIGHLLIASLAFLIPALSAWRMKRIWHCYLFVIMALICTCHHLCSADTSRHMGMHTLCAPTVTNFFSHAFSASAHFCVLQMAFLIMGPEDPHMQWLNLQAAPSDACGETPLHAPFDAIVTARVVPAVVLCLFHFSRALMDTEEILWQSILLNESILLVCCTSFWMHHSRIDWAADVLVRFKFWHRLLHHGFIPAMMLFWIFCLKGLADLQAFSSLWYLVVASFAVSLLRAVLVGESSLPSAKVFDISLNNPNVADVLLGSVGLIVLPTALIGASFDWCSMDNSRWPTIATTTQCRQGSYFVALVSIPTFVALATAFWLIASTSPTKTTWFQFHTSKLSWKSTERLAGENALEELSFDAQQLALGKSRGCFLGYAGAFLGIVAAMIVRSTPFQDTWSFLCNSIAGGFIAVAMALTALSCDPSTRRYRCRQRFTMLVVVPVVLLYMILILSNKFLAIHVPHSACAMTEYLVVMLMSVWPLTWVREVQEVWQTNANCAFVWPKTNWRFT